MRHLINHSWARHTFLEISTLNHWLICECNECLSKQEYFQKLLTEFTYCSISENFRIFLLNFQIFRKYSENRHHWWTNELFLLKFCQKGKFWRLGLWIVVNITMIIWWKYLVPVSLDFELVSCGQKGAVWCPLARNTDLCEPWSWY